MKHRTVRTVIWIAVCLITLITLSACFGGNNLNEQTNNLDEEGGGLVQENEHDEDNGPHEGGMLTMAMFSAPLGVFNPLLTWDAYDANVTSIVFEGLVKQNEQLQWEPALASDWTFAEDAQTLTVELREDVLWHDGTRFTAQDVKFTYETVAHPDYEGPYQSFVRELKGFTSFQDEETALLEGVEVVDMHTVSFHFERPYPAALQLASLPLIPEHIYGSYAVSELASASEAVNFDEIVGTGPFQAKAFVRNQFYELERFEDYWQGSPHLERIKWVTVNQDVAAGLVRAEDVDLITFPDSKRIQNDPDLFHIDHLVIHEYPSPVTHYVGLKLAHRPAEDIENNTLDVENLIQNEKLHNEQLRQALMIALNRQLMIDILLNGQGTIIDIPFHANWGLADFGQLTSVSFQKNAANRLLDEAGFVDHDDDGYRELPDESALELGLFYYTGHDLHSRLVNYIVQDFSEIGIKVMTRGIDDPNEYFEAVINDHPEMDMFIDTWELNTDDMDPGPYWENDSLWNVSRWVHDEQQSLLEQARTKPEGTDDNVRLQTYADWAEIYQEQWPYLILFQENNYTFYHEKIKQVKEHPLHFAYNIHEWYVEIDESNAE